MEIGIGLSITKLGARAVQDLLFLWEAGEDGTWLDISDDRVRFQTDTDETLAADAGDTIGLILDKHTGSIALGPELVTNGDFPVDISGWLQNGAGDNTIAWNASGYMDITRGAGGTSGHPYQSFTTVVGKTYRLSVTIPTGVSMHVRVGTSIGDSSYIVVTMSNETKTFTFVATSTTTYFSAWPQNSSTTSAMDNITCKEYAGNPAPQATASKRPILGVSGLLKFADHDGVDDILTMTFPNLGVDCTVAYVDSSLTILTGQTISGAFVMPTSDWYQFVVMDRALTAGETDQLTSFMNAKAGL